MAVNKVSPFRVTNDKNFFSLFLHHSPYSSILSLSLSLSLSPHTHTQSSSVPLSPSGSRLVQPKINMLQILIAFYTRTDSDLPR